MAIMAGLHAYCKILSTESMNKRQQHLVSYFRKNFRGDYLVDEPLADHTWYRIGGPADFFAYPRDEDDLVGLLRYCRNSEVNAYLLGEGANVLAHDDGYRGVIISLTRYFTKICRDDVMVEAGAGVLLPDLVLFCEENGLGGLACMSGIPGSVGGALVMNAGTRDGEFGDRVVEATVLDSNLELLVMSKKEIRFKYRSALALQDKTVLSCRLGLAPERGDVLRDVRLGQLKKRAEKQPLEYPSCGSVFKAPEHRFVGQMVEEAGLKGLRSGDAMISEKHGGFIINLGRATARDVMCLIEKVRGEIGKRYNVLLEPEVRFLGF